MKLRFALPTVALAVAGVLPAIAPTAGAVDTTQVTIVDGYQYDAESLIGKVVCFDDTIVQDGEVVINPAITSTPGAHTLSVTQDSATSCTDDVTWITADVTLLDVPSQALAFGWPDYSNQTPTLPVWQFEDDLSCTPADQGRIVFRNINTADATAYFGQTDGIDMTALFSDVAIGDQAAALVASPTYPTTGEAAGWRMVGDTSYAFYSSDTSYLTDPGTVNVIYAYAGNDGDIGLVNQVLPASVCDNPTTTTTTPPADAPTAVAPAAVAVTTQPTYTG